MKIKPLFGKKTAVANGEAPVRPIKDAKKLKRRRRWIILGVVVLVIAGLLANCSMQAAKLASQVAFSETAVLARTDLMRTIGATGTVESKNSHTVYSTQNYPVKAVYVEVGDVVSEGDLLCELDAGSLEDQIASQELSTGMSAAAAAQQVKTARDAYNAAKQTLDEGLNTGILSAQNNVRTSYDAWQKAQSTYQNYKASLKHDTNATLIAQDNAVNTAQNAYNTAKSAYDAALAARDAAQAALDTFTTQGGDPGAIAAAQAAKNAADADLALKQSTRDNAFAAYQAAETTYNNDPSAANQNALATARDFYDNAERALSAAQSAAAAAANALDAINHTPDSAEHTRLKNDLAAKETALKSATTARDNARNAYDSARAQRDAAYDNADTSLSDYARAVDTAYANYQAALLSLESAEKSANTQLQSSKNALDSARINGNTDSAVLRLAQLQEDLEQTSIKANASGTVTAVYAKVGANGAGLLFVIEDTDNLVVETSVSGYDVGDVQPGMAVTIKSDATGDTVIDGRVQSIAPTSQKNQQGQTNTTGDVLFLTKVDVLGQNSGLLIGMSVRLHYIVAQEADVIAVPFDALYEKEDGASYVLRLSDSGNGKHLIEEVAVLPGLESDLNVAITGDGVHEGMRVLSNPSEFRAMIGREITLVEDSPALAAIRSMRPFAAAGN